MILRTIRSRMLAATLVPLGLFVLIVTLVFWSGRFNELDQSHMERARLLVRQLALASEYPIFSGNISNLQSLVNSTHQESDVVSVVVCDRNNMPLVVAGQPGFQRCNATQDGAYVTGRSNAGIDTLSQTIVSSLVPLDDFFTNPSAQSGGKSDVMGFAVVEMSRQRLTIAERQAAFIALLVGLMGVVMGGLLALQMGRGVVIPIQNVAVTIARIGRGELSVQAKVEESDPLHELQRALNRMAERLAAGRDELQQRIALATHELRERTDEAEAAPLAKSRFLAAASHDLRQPLHALGMFIARFGQLTLNAEPRALVTNLEASVQSMQDLLDGLLDLSRLEGGAVQVQMQPIHLQALMESVAQSIRPTVDDKGLRLRMRCTDQWVLSDPVLLNRIMLNLVNNAVRYTETGTVLVACRVREGGSRVQIQVWDSGIGISAEHQQNIFKEFYQVGNAGRNRALGLGLGLNIVERSAKLLNHPVHLCSVLGRGTRVTITVESCMRPAQQSRGALDYQESGESAARAHILVIEDDKLAREALRDLLESWNYDVVAVAGSEDAQAHVRLQGVPDVIVSDFRLGGTENGLSTIAAIRLLALADVPACVMSGDTDAGLILAAKEAGLTLLHKPVRPAKLRNLLRHLVQG